MSHDPAPSGTEPGGPAGGVHQEWRLDGPRVLDVGGEGERVSALRVAVVGGRVDVVTHDDSPTARVEVTSVTGLPVHVRWDGHTLSVTHGKDSDTNLLEMIRRTVESFGRNAVVVSISVPVATDASVSTVGATALLSGLRGRVRANTVSGQVTLSDLQGDLDLNTVSGDVECTEVVGALKVNAVSGGVTVQAGDLPSVKVNTVSGDIVLDLTSGRCDLASTSVSGDITVRAPLGGYDVEGSTASGQVVVDGTQVSGGGHGQGHGRHGKGRGGHVREGDGALRVRAHSVSGDLVVLRATAGAGGAQGRDHDPQGTGPQDAGPQWAGPQAGPQDAPVAHPFAPPAPPTPPAPPAPPGSDHPGHPQDHLHDPWAEPQREGWADRPEPGATA